MPPNQLKNQIFFGESASLLLENGLANNDFNDGTTIPIITEEFQSTTPKSPPSTLPLWRDEMNHIMKLCIPVIGTNVFELFPGVVSILLVSHISEDAYQNQVEFDATSTAVVFMNMVAVSVGFGLSSALDTLCSQAHGGAASSKGSSPQHSSSTSSIMSVYFKTSVVVCISWSLVVAVIFCYSEDILLALNQPPAVSHFTSIFLWYLLPGVPFLLVYNAMSRVMQAQNVAQPQFYVSVVANLVHVALGYYLVFHTEWGWLGAAVARSMCNISFFVLLLPYYIDNSSKDDGTGSSVFFTFDVFLLHLPEFLTLGLPGMFQLCLEWWTFEMVTLLCGTLPRPLVAIAAHAIIMNVSSVVYMCYLGLSVSASVRVGNALGAQEVERAKLASGLTLCFGVVVAVVNAGFLLSMRKVLPRWFIGTHDEETINLGSNLLIVAAVFQIPDMVNAVVQGVLIGSGRQGLGAQLNFVAYYLIGIPTGCFLGFRWHRWGVVGIWIGLVLGLVVMAIGGIFIIVQSDWDALAKKARERTREETKEGLPIKYANET